MANKPSEMWSAVAEHIPFVSLVLVVIERYWQYFEHSQSTKIRQFHHYHHVKSSIEVVDPSKYRKNSSEGRTEVWFYMYRRREILFFGIDWIGWARIILWSIIMIWIMHRTIWIRTERFFLMEFFWLDHRLWSKYMNKFFSQRKFIDIE